MHTVKRTEGFCRERRAYMHQAQLVDPNECVLVTGVGVSPREAMMSLLKHTERMQADQLAALNEVLK